MAVVLAMGVNCEKGCEEVPARVNELWLTVNKKNAAPDGVPWEAVVLPHTCIKFKEFFLTLVS